MAVKTTPKLIHSLILLQCGEAGWETPETEFPYVPGRKFRADYAWKARQTLLEVQGGIFMAKSGHSGISGLLRDLERGNHAAVNGWRLLRLTPSQIRNGELTGWLKAMKP